jgi:hypothetical protein
MQVSSPTWGTDSTYYKDAVFPIPPQRQAYRYYYQTRPAATLKGLTQNALLATIPKEVNTD